MIEMVGVYEDVNLIYRYNVDFQYDTEAVDTWIHTYLENRKKDHPESADISHRLTQQHLQITQALLVAAGFPIFRPGNIIAITDHINTNQWKASLACPWMDGLALNSLRTTLSAGFELLRRIRESLGNSGLRTGGGRTLDSWASRST